VLGSRKQDTLLHKAGGITDAGNIGAVRLDLKLVEIDATEDNSGVGGSGNETNSALDSSVKTYAIGLHRAVDSSLLHL
jgi:hypothetical protein